MAQSMRDIKRRIKSIVSTKKITNAMELVSSAKFMKAATKLEGARPCYHAVINHIQELMNDLEGMKHPFLERRKIKKTLCIVISDDRGMSGGYNSNVLRVAEDLIREKSQKIDFIIIGTKAINYFSRENAKSANVIKEYTGITENPQISQIKEICDIMTTMYKNKKADRIQIVYTRYENTITQDPQILQVLPVEKFIQRKAKNKKVIEFEPSVESFLDSVIPKYVESCLYGALVEAACSQQAARRIAMEVATENADEMISELKNTYNKVRQSAITTELNEIIAGIQAVKS
jgi:F-type H+-transporting ATPase subunit gamma